VEASARGSLPRDVDLERVWHGVTGEIWARDVSATERFAARLLGSPGLARALVTTPSLLLSWILASLVVIGLGLLVTVSAGGPWVAILAPALAAIGVAYAYGPGIDEAYELTRTTAISDRMILLVRVLAVFALNALLAIIVAGFYPAAVGIAWLWLAPMAAMAALALAVATFTRSAFTGSATALTVWGSIVFAAQLETKQVAAAGTLALIPIYLLVAAVCVVAILAMTGSGKGGAILWR
jgi:hypothetical protein